MDRTSQDEEENEEESTGAEPQPEEQEKEVEKEEEEEEEEEEEIDPRKLLTKEQVETFKAMFESFDPQKKERIPAKTIGYALRWMGLNPTKAEIRKIMEEMDPLSKGLVDFQTFLLPIAQRINQESETHEDIIAAFKLLDEENNEFLYTDKMTEYLTSLGEDLEDFEIELLMKMAESKGTGKVHYVDFVEKIMGIVRKNGKDKGKKGKKGKKN